MRVNAGTLAAVFVGGASGTALRALITLGFGEQAMWGTVTVNIIGSYALGCLSAALLGRTTARGYRVQAALGTGLLGGFTSYSAFAIETSELVATAHYGLLLLYLGITVLGGFTAALLGVFTGKQLRGVQS